METQRRFLHPYDPNILVIDVLDENGHMIRTKNFVIKKDPSKCYHPWWEADIRGCNH